MFKLQDGDTHTTLIVLTSFFSAYNIKQEAYKRILVKQYEQTIRISIMVIELVLFSWLVLVRAGKLDDLKNMEDFKTMLEGL